MTDTPITPQQARPTDADNIRRGGLRRLRAGLPLEVGPLGAGASGASGHRDHQTGPTSLAEFSSEIERTLIETTKAEQTALLIRADHRPIPQGPTKHVLGRWQLNAVLEERLLSLHPDLMTIALNERQLVVFVPNLRRRDDGEQLLAKVFDALLADVVIDQLPHVLEPRVGGALLDDANPDAARLFEAAEVALSESDSAHHHVLFHPHQRVRAEQQSDLDTALRATIVEHGLTVALQPAVDLGSGKIVAIEAFARWERPGHGTVATPDLIQTATSLGILNRVDEQILQKALFDVSDWVDEGLLDDVTLWLNMTTTDVLDRHLVRTILDGAQLNDRVKVGIELSPSSSPDTQAVLSTLRALTSKGVRAAIGDFGVGFASFSEVRHLPFDSVKLDRSLMTQIAADQSAADIVQHLVGIADTIGLEATAQGIEHDDQLELVRSMGCPIAQGYVFTEPLPPEEFRDFITTWDPTKVAEDQTARSQSS